MDTGLTGTEMAIVTIITHQTVQMPSMEVLFNLDILYPHQLVLNPSPATAITRVVVIITRSDYLLQVDTQWSCLEVLLTFYLLILDIERIHMNDTVSVITDQEVIHRGQDLVYSIHLYHMSDLLIQESQCLTMVHQLD